MIIAIDAGNSRIKWGVHDGCRWLASGVLATTDVASLREAAGRMAGRFRGSSSATLPALKSLQRSRHSWRRAPPGSRSCAPAPPLAVVRSAYQSGQLGADRWAALIGARSLFTGASLVVCAGTATTVDLLDAEGVFRGGLIVPGFDLMRAALARNTAQLPFAEGVFCAEPRNTMDAIVSGCLQAQLGAIERMFAAIAAEPGARCLLTGGGGGRLAAHLKIPFQLVDNLVLNGLLRFAFVS